MKYWLQRAPAEAPPVNVVEFAAHRRRRHADFRLEVRRLLARGDFDSIAELVPPTTLRLLISDYASSVRNRSEVMDDGRSADAAPH